MLYSNTIQNQSKPTCPSVLAYYMQCNAINEVPRSQRHTMCAQSYSLFAPSVQHPQAP
jgi:hypothetical protein